MDKDKIIKALECCCESDSFDKPNCKDCPAECMSWYMSIPFIQQVLALLKEQEAVVAHWDDDTGHWIEGDRNGIDTHARTTGEMIDTFRCSWCGFYQYWKTPFCPNCGAKMERSVK